MLKGTMNIVILPLVCDFVLWLLPDYFLYDGITTNSLLGSAKARNMRFTYFSLQ